MPDSFPPDGGDIRPLSRRSSRILVVLAVVAAFAIAIASALFLSRTAEETQQRQQALPPDSTQAR